MLPASNGIVFIADEIQTGFCRTGDWFACDHEGVVPDLITTAKGIAGGLPLAAVTGRAEIMDAVHAGGLGGTYGGNPVACAAALGAIETMAKEDLPRGGPRDRRRSCCRGCARWRQQHPVIGDVRGRGAMIADRAGQAGHRWSRTPAATRQRSPRPATRPALIVLTCGTYGNVLRFLPPLVISDELLTEGLTILEDAFGAL